MAYRTTADQVRAIIEVDATIAPSDSDLEPFISAANELVTECCADAGYSVSRLEQIERWLAAHVYAIRDPRVKSEQAGPVAVTYESDTDLFLDSSKYGQMAKLLDTAGGLAALEEQIKAGGPTVVGVTWLGTPTTTGL